MFYINRIKELERRLGNLENLVMGRQPKKHKGARKIYKKPCEICKKKVKWMKSHMWNIHQINKTNI